MTSNLTLLMSTSTTQDARFTDKEKKLMKIMKFEDVLSTKVDMSKVKLDVIKPWIAERVMQLLGMEDDVVTEFIFNQLEAKDPDPRKMQINLTGFLNGKNARLFMGELWTHLDSAQSSEAGIPLGMIEKKADEIKNRNDAARRIEDAIGRRRSRSGSRERRRSRSPRRRSRSPRGFGGGGGGFGGRRSRSPRGGGGSPRGGRGGGRNSNLEPLGQPSTAKQSLSPVVEKALPDSTIDPSPQESQSQVAAAAPAEDVAAAAAPTAEPEAAAPAATAAAAAATGPTVVAERVSAAEESHMKKEDIE